jgi:hypothetical protein
LRAGSECDAYGRLKQAKFDILSCKIHLSYDMKRVVEIQSSDSHAVKKQKLEAEAAVSMGRNEWREQSMSEAERQSRLQMKEASRAYLQEKWGVLQCKLKDLPCKKPWPYCPLPCPRDVPDCARKGASWEDLDAIHNRVVHAFLHDEDQPLTPAA